MTSLHAETGRLVLVIADMELSDMSGHALVERLREIDPAIPIVMTSADYRQEIEIDARKAGILYYAHKPIDYRGIEAVVAKALAGWWVARRISPTEPPAGVL